MLGFLPRLVTGAALGAMVLAAGCGGEGGNANGAPEVPDEARYGGTAVVASIVDPPTLSAFGPRETISGMIQREVLFMPLLRYDPDLGTSPWLAERWDTTRVAPDSLELTFHLRRDVRWHDGRPTTAEDVRFTFERTRDPEVASPLGSALTHYAPEVVVVDPHTLRLRLRPHAEFLDVWAQMAIMPEHLLGDVPVDQLARHAFGTTQPVGNGPFRFVRRTMGQEWVFEANPDFPQELGGRPYLDRLVYRVIPEQTTLLTEFLTGGVDLYLALNPAQVQQVESSADARVLSAPATLWTSIAWNTRLPMFDSPEERRALSMAIDREQLVQAVLQRHGESGRSPVTPGHWSFEKSPRTALPYSHDSARQLLAQAGWADRDGDGILEDAGGRPFRFTLKAPAGNKAREDVLQVVQAQLRSLGIDVRPSLIEGGTLIGQLSRVPRDFEAVLMGWSDGLRKDDRQMFHSRNLDGPMQVANFSNPRVDQLLDTLDLVVDREQARPLWREYQELMAQEAPHSVLYYPQRLLAVRNRIQGVEADARGEFASVARWWISPQGREGSAPEREP